MAETAFNTIAEVQRLRDAGFEQKQAEAITLSIHAGVTGGVATKADIDLLRAEVVSGDKALKAEIDLLRAEVVSGDKALKAEIDLLRKDVEQVEERLDGKIDLLRKDLEQVEERLDGKIDTGIATLRAEIATTKVDLTWRILAGIAIFNGALFAALRYLPQG